MSFTKMSDRVRYTDGQVYTLGELLDLGLARVRKVDNLYSKRVGTVTAYFADIIVDGEIIDSGWRIGQKAYNSRKEKGQ